MSTYYVAGVPYSDELYHYGRKGMEWGKNKFGKIGYTTKQKTYTPGGKLDRAVDKVKKNVSSGAKKIGTFVTGGNYKKRADEAEIQKYKYGYSGESSKARNIRERAEDAKKKSEGFGRDKEYYIDSYNKRKFFDVAGRQEDLKRIDNAEYNQNNLRSIYDKGMIDYQKQRKSDYDKAVEYDSQERLLRKMYDKTLPGAISKAANVTVKSIGKGVSSASTSVGKAVAKTALKANTTLNNAKKFVDNAGKSTSKTATGVAKSISKTASSATKSVSNVANKAGNAVSKVASKSAKSITSWGSKAVSKGKSSITSLFGGKKKQSDATKKTISKPKKGSLTK